jgi:hypothetical protein
VRAVQGNYVSSGASPWGNLIPVASSTPGFGAGGPQHPDPLPAHRGGRRLLLRVGDHLVPGPGPLVVGGQLSTAPGPDPVQPGGQLDPAADHTSAHAAARGQWKYELRRSADRVRRGGRFYRSR